MTHANHQELSAGIPAYVEKFGPRSLKDLTVAFVGQPTTAAERQSFRLRLKRLVEAKRLTVIGERDDRRYSAAGKGVQP